MGGDLIRRLEAGAIAILLLVGVLPARAQGLIDLVPRQEFSDENGVDIAGAVYRHHETLLRIGGGPHPLALNLHYVSPGLPETADCPSPGPGHLGNAIYHALDSDAYLGNTGGTALFTAVLPHQSAKFGMYGQSTGSLYTTIVPSDAAYVTMAYDPTNTYFNYVGGDGTEAVFSPLHRAQWSVGFLYNWGNADLVRFPDGETWTYRYNDVQYASPICHAKVSRIRSIVSSRGYAIQFDYAADPASPVSSQNAIQDFVTIVRATAYNKAAVHCDEAALASCASVRALSSAVTFVYDQGSRRVSITMPNGEQIELSFTLYGTLNLTGVTRPGGVSRTMTYTEYGEQDGPTYRSLNSLSEGGRTWGYGYSPNDSGRSSSTSVNDPGGAVTHYWFTGGIPYMILDPLGRQTQVDYDGYMRLHRRRYPEGNEVTAAYDSRGNLNLVRHIPKPGSGQPVLEASATFPPSCTAVDRRSCNRPSSVTDRNGNRTDYTYSPEHGGILTETGPAVATRQHDNSFASVRPQKRYDYAQRHAWIANGAGGHVRAATPVWLPVRERHCRTTPAAGSGCAGGAIDEVVTDYDYGPDVGPNNLSLRGIAVTADGGSGLVTRRTCYGYDAAGNRISETEPNANLASCP
jgi:YD repeat-containing protein